MAAIIKTLYLCFLFMLIGCGQPMTQAVEGAGASQNSLQRLAAISSNCQAWFDGCNHCTLYSDGKAYCTSKSCQMMGQPQCLDQNTGDGLGNIAHPPGI